jgi:hypothetical protein
VLAGPRVGILVRDARGDANTPKYSYEQISSTDEDDV